MLNDVERYLALRRSFGFKLARVGAGLKSFARHAAVCGDTHVRTQTALSWAGAASSARQSYERLGDVARFARFIQSEDPIHEIPPVGAYVWRRSRPAPYIYTEDEIAGLLEAAGQLRHQRDNPLRREIYVTLFGLLAATGLRISEALSLTFDDVLSGGVLRIRETKFYKSRLVPLHETVAAALNRYLEARRRLPALDDHLFLSVKGKPFCYNAARVTFVSLLNKANIAPDRLRRPRIHDLRHTFATRALERCGEDRNAIARQFVALSTYLGHADVKHTYWYLEATPDLMSSMAIAAEALMAREAA
ncbi:MAG: tyrosine-type recombinase/integrase [Rhodomicrobium sp.]|nr:tyrosine-type recombinase/integrase [Rhodomicrobium sp.]